MTVTQLIAWTPETSVNIALFDEQHKGLIDVTNAMLEAMDAHAPQPELNALLGEILRLTREHFASEEAAFEEHNYPGARVHKGDHDQILAELIALKRFSDEGRLELTPQTAHYFVHGLEHHITGSDRNYIAYLNGCGVH